MTPPIGGRPRVYNPQEREVIDKFKARYMMTTSPAERKNLAQGEIFPAVFDHWSKTGVDLTPEETNIRSEKLLKWIRNVWRVRKTPVFKTTGYRLTDILWWTRQDEVFEEIASILGLDSADTTTPGWFQLRTKASKNIIDRMSADVRNVLEDEQDRLENEGLPRDVQRKIAEDKWYSRLSSSAKKNFKEMGLVQISVAVFTDKSGNLAVDIHDDIAKLFGVPAPPFESMFREKAKEMKKILLEYIMVLRRDHFGNVPSTQNDSNISPEIGALQCDAAGFPKAPRPNSWAKVKKAELETFYRLYITRQYQMACRDKTRQAPFERIAASTSEFISPEYLPNGVSFQDPRSMKLDSLVKFFQHVFQREASYGISNAFRFKSILSSRKKGDIRPSRYEDEGNDAEGAEDDPPIRRRRRRPPHTVNLEHTLLNDRLSSHDDDDSEDAEDDQPLRPTRQRPPQTLQNNRLSSHDNDQSSAALRTGLQTPDKSPTPGRNGSGLLTPVGSQSNQASEKVRRKSSRSKIPEEEPSRELRKRKGRV